MKDLDSLANEIVLICSSLSQKDKAKDLIRDYTAEYHQRESATLRNLWEKAESRIRKLKGLLAEAKQLFPTEKPEWGGLPKWIENIKTRIDQELAEDRPAEVYHCYTVEDKKNSEDY